MRLDGVIHGMIEQNPRESVMKFIHHSLVSSLGELRKSRELHERRSEPLGEFQLGNEDPTWSGSLASVSADVVHFLVRVCFTRMNYSCYSMRQ